MWLCKTKYVIIKLYILQSQHIQNLRVWKIHTVKTAGKDPKMARSILERYVHSQSNQHQFCFERNICKCGCLVRIHLSSYFLIFQLHYYHFQYTSIFFNNMAYRLYNSNCTLISNLMCHPLYYCDIINNFCHKLPNTLMTQTMQRIKNYS